MVVEDDETGPGAAVVVVVVVAVVAVVYAGEGAVTEHAGHWLLNAS